MSKGRRQSNAACWQQASRSPSSRWSRRSAPTSIRRSRPSRRRCNNKRSLRHRPKPVNGRSTSVRHHRGSVGVGCTMGHLPASERPRSCSLGAGPFVFFGLASATRFAPPSFTRHINGLRQQRAPALVHAAEISGVPAERKLARRHLETTTKPKPVHGAARPFLFPHG
jgi:hypothetical protein